MKGDKVNNSTIYRLTMIYPTIAEYKEAILSAGDNFETLNQLRPVIGSDGEPIMTSGNFAVVFKMKDEYTGKFHAVKCFIKEQEGRAESYNKIVEELEFVNSPYFSQIRYLDKELFVDSNSAQETEFPVLLMDWEDGIPLDKYLRNHIDNQYELSLLAYQFSRLAMWLMQQPFAHGDLKPDNILVKEDGTLVLVDYDGMYVPAMNGELRRELGSPDFQHPSRTERSFDEHIDDFSITSILLSLKAIALRPDLLEKYGAQDRLLLSEKDYRSIDSCNLLKEIYPSDDSELNVLVSLFTIALEKTSFSNIPTLLFNLVRPTIPEKEELLSTTATREDFRNAWIDEFGVLYSSDRKRLLSAQKKLRSYSIRIGTKVICSNAFANCTTLRFINIPDSVNCIGFGTFNGCSSLTNLNIPISITSIEKWSFKGCTGLTHMNLPNSITSIGEYAFKDCTGLKHLGFPNSVKIIGRGAFCGCTNLIHVDIPNSITIIREECFYGCTSLKHISIPNSVVTIGNDAFRFCRAINQFSIPNSVSTIGHRAFWGCTKLTNISIPNSVKSIGDDALSYCNALTSLVIPESVTNFGRSVLRVLTNIVVDKNNPIYDSQEDCNAIIVKKSNTLITGCQNTIIPNSVTRIGANAFAWCIGLNHISIPNSIVSIEYGAFAGCAELKRIIIPDSVKTIEAYAFMGCIGLNQIVVDDNNPIFDSRDSCNAIITRESDILVAGCKNTVIPKSITTIGEGAFRDCKSLVHINIPNSVTNIESCAFWGCTSLTSIIIPDSVKTIGGSAFNECTSLTYISLPKSVVSIGHNAFPRCKGLTRIHIPNGSRKKFEELLPYDKDLLIEQ